MMKPQALLLAAALLALSTSARADPADGFVDPEEVCGGGFDLSSQDDLFRPYGGVLLVPALLPQPRFEAIRKAARDRFNESGAVWRLVPYTLDATPVGIDAVLFASCPEGPGPDAIAAYKASGGLGVRWEALSPSVWQATVAGRLAVLEGNGPI